MRLIIAISLFATVVITGCMAPPPAPIEPVVDDAEAMTYLGAGLRPEIALFPDYLLIEGFELTQHGIIPDTQLIGAGLVAASPLRAVRRAFDEVLLTHGWEIQRLDTLPQSFRLMAARKEEHVEIRAVQGTGATQVFVLYSPLGALE